MRCFLGETIIRMKKIINKKMNQKKIANQRMMRMKMMMKANGAKMERKNKHKNSNKV